MKITVAIDSFKGSLNTFESGKAVTDGILRVFPDAVVSVRPIADGGEGTVEALVSANCGELISTQVCGPLGEAIDASYGYISKTNTAVIEMSAAAGITLVPAEKKNPYNTTTYGVGELILHALDKGCRSFVIGIGGSATNDGGVGMLQALGFEFFDSFDIPISLGAKGLKDLSRISCEKADRRIKESSFSVACDVTNPLCGSNGCSAIYGPQKGADEEMIKNMDRWLENYADLTKRVLNSSDKKAKGSGAAGGLGFALMSYLDAKLVSGIDLVIKETELEKYISDSDIVITGEGRLDAQSSMGKAPVGVAKIAKKYNKPVIAFSGAVIEGATLCNNVGIDAYFPILRTPCSLDDAMNIQNASRNLSDSAEQVFRLIKSFMR